MELSIDQALSLAIEHHQKGNLEQAKHLYVTILASEPENAHALNLLGVIKLSEGNIDEALRLIGTSLQYAPDNPLALVNLGLAYDTKGQIDTAIECYQLALGLSPKMPEAILNLGSCHLKKGDHNSARQHFEKLLSLQKNNSDALSNLGKIAEETGDLCESRSYYEKALACNPDNINALINIGQLLRSQGQLVQAVEYYDKAIKSNPSASLAHFNRATALLSLGEFEKGWKDYEWRIMSWTGRRYVLAPTNQQQLPPPSTLMPLDLSGKRILLLADQGIGDELFFLRFVKRFKEQGSSVFFKASPKLTPLIKRWNNVTLWPDTPPYPETDYTFSIGDAALITGMNTKEDIPDSIQIRPISAMVDQVLHEYKDIPRPWLGITWEAGTRASAGQLHKNIDLTALLASIAHWPGSLIIVQRNPEKKDILTIKKAFGNRAVDCSKMNNDLEYALAVLSQLDTYVGVSNTNMHLMAMLGGGAQVLIPLETEFRWMHNTNVSPWFPSFRIYRQSQDREWKAALDKLKSDISNMGKSSPNAALK